MDYSIVGSIFTVVVFVSFIGVVLWAYSKRSKAAFDEAANLVFDDEPQPIKQHSTQKKQESSINE
jgi:cytochrome c oxidase cbb3-type subunit 4